MNLNLTTITYPEEGEFQHAYSPLHNLVKGGALGDFTINIDKFPLNINNPISIECQPSYDGTVNLIISDDENPIRLINSRFTKTENGRFKIINRDQIEQTNIYKDTNISSTNLVLHPKKFPRLKYKDILSCGTLAGGNYTFYMKYVDGDGNESDFVAETFQIPVFKGNVNNPKTVSGALVDERTDKAILLMLSDLETTFQKIKLYYTRETSDLNGVRFTKAYEIMKTFQITGSEMEIMVSGYEETDESSVDIINSNRFSFTSAKTQCQLQNMLFLGNISKTTYDIYKLRNAALFFKVQWTQDDKVGWVDPKNYSVQLDSEYYDPENVCYKTGYWPGEFYRLGVVFILEDGEHTDVFNLRGCRFDRFVKSNLNETDTYVINGVKQNLKANSFFPSTIYQNSYGVFQNPNLANHEIINYDKKEIKPIHYIISLEDKDVIEELRSCGVKGWFFVRQKRIPITLFQGLSLDVDTYSGSPMLWDGNKYFTESFLVNTPYGVNSTKRHIVQPDTTLISGKTFSTTSSKTGCALISPDASFIPDLQNTLCGSEVIFEKQSETTVPISDRRNFIFYPKDRQTEFITKARAVFVNEDIPYKIVDEYQFSTRFGSPESTKDVSFFGKELDGINHNKSYSAYHKDNTSILRGIYTSFVGVCSDLAPQCLYSVKIGDYSDSYVKMYMENRGYDHSAFFAISNKFYIPEKNTTFAPEPIWSGDCYTNTVTIRLNRNFTDPDAPINSYILSPDTWRENYKGYMKMKASKTQEESEKVDKEFGDYYKINRGDLNSAPMGMWVTFKLLSSYNLGLRAEDRNHTEEMALMGNPRSFYPLTSMSVAPNAKISESRLLNLGYSATVGAKEYYEAGEVPYAKNLFDNRVAYSNIQVEDDFKNGYRIFSEVAYQDIDRQYGAIVKLLPWGTNLLCVFEHGIGILPVNQRALLQTQEGPLSLGGAGVLQSNVQLISGDFGSIWPDSVIKTNIGVYGIDTYAKKIWRYSDANGFELLSDMKVQRFLNDNIVLSERDKFPIVALKNVKTHFNAHKGDVMFTFYNHLEGVEWNLCYNERLGKWITRYSWIPLCSENINNIYYSLDKKRAMLLSYISEVNNNSPVTIENFVWETMANENNFQTSIVLDSDDYEGFSLNLVSAETSYFDEKDSETFINISKEELVKFCKWLQNDQTNGTLIIDGGKFKDFINSYFPIPESEYKVGWNIEQGDMTDEEYKEAIKQAKQEYESNVEQYWEYAKNNPGEYPEGVDHDLYDQYLMENGNFNSLGEVNYFQPEMPLYVRIDVEISTINKGYIPPTPLKKSIVIVSGKTSRSQEQYDKMMVNGFYVHGRAGIFDEMDYNDDNPDNQIQPTKWYDKQEPFEFEFVVNSPVGLHKIFDNLVIISNNVQPNSIEYTIEGDTYSLFKDKDLFNNNIKRQLYKSGTGFKNAKLNYDTILNQYSLTIHQDCKNIANPKYGRRLGNIQYKEDSWYVTIDPLVFDPMLKASPEDQKTKWASTRIRDKFLKVRVKYTGEDLVIITAIKNLCTLSRA